MNGSAIMAAWRMPRTMKSGIMTLRGDMVKDWVANQTTLSRYKVKGFE